MNSRQGMVLYLEAFIELGVKIHRVIYSFCIV